MPQHIRLEFGSSVDTLAMWDEDVHGAEKMNLAAGRSAKPSTEVVKGKKKH